MYLSVEGVDAVLLVVVALETEACGGRKWRRKVAVQLPLSRYCCCYLRLRPPLDFWCGGGDDGDDQVVLEGASLVAGVEAGVLNRDGERETRSLFRERETVKNEKKNEGKSR